MVAVTSMKVFAPMSGSFSSGGSSNLEIVVYFSKSSPSAVLSMDVVRARRPVLVVCRAFNVLASVIPFNVRARAACAYRLMLSILRFESSGRKVKKQILAISLMLVMKAF